MIVEKAYAFLCANTLSGEYPNMAAGRKPERVNETKGVVGLQPFDCWDLRFESR
jgi:hypothetical protein